jgi:heat-inducible transcriptional repressor
LLKDTSALLSDVSHYPAVVIGPGFGTEEIRGVHLVHLSASVLLAVTVSESGRVSQELVRLSFDPADGEMDEAEMILDRIYAGKSLDDAVKAVEGIDRSAIPERVVDMIRSVAGALRRTEKSTSDIYIGGTSQLAGLWEDLANVSAILGILERDSALRDVLGDEDGPTVRIGAELNLEDLDLSVVSMPYGAGDKGAGRVGVLGPMRMDYRRALRIVEEVGEGLGDSFGT